MLELMKVTKPKRKQEKKRNMRKTCYGIVILGGGAEMVNSDDSLAGA